MQFANSYLPDLSSAGQMYTVIVDEFQESRSRATKTLVRKSEGSNGSLLFLYSEPNVNKLHNKMN